MNNYILVDKIWSRIF